MIEGPSSGPSPAPRKPSPSAWIERVSSWLRLAPARLRNIKRPAKKAAARTDVFLWRLQLVNRGFWVLLGGLMLYLAVDLLALKPDPPVMFIQSAPTGAESSEVNAYTVEDRLKPLAEYQAALAARNPFQLARRTETEPREADVPVDTLATLTGALTVVGMNRGGVPEALVEDTEAKRTYIVQVGDELNGMMVVAIDPQGVTVRYEGEEALIP